MRDLACLAAGLPTDGTARWTESTRYLTGMTGAARALARPATSSAGLGPAYPGGRLVSSTDTRACRTVRVERATERRVARLMRAEVDLLRWSVAVSITV